MVYAGGLIPAQISQAEAQLDIALSQLGTVEENVALRTRLAFYNVLLSQALVSSAEQNLTAAQAQLAVANARFEVGVAPRFDVLRAQTQVSQAQQTLTEALNSVALAFTELSRAMGVDQASRYELVDPGQSPFPEENLEALIEVAERGRSELLAARAEVAAQRAGIRIARSETRPQVSVTATYQDSTEETGITQGEGLVVLVGASIELFNGGRTRANVRRARALTRSAEANLEDTEQQVEQDVREAYLELATARQTIETARTRLAQAQEAYDIAVIRYQAGVGTAVELADALAQLTTARTNLDQSVYNYNIAYARLRRALGEVE